MSQTRGSHSSLRQSHLKSETGQRREENIKIRFVYLIFFFFCHKGGSGMTHLVRLLLK